MSGSLEKIYKNNGVELMVIPSRATGFGRENYRRSEMRITTGEGAGCIFFTEGAESDLE